MVKLVKAFAVLVTLLRARSAAGAGLRKEPLPDAEEFSSSLEAGGVDPPLPEGHRHLSGLRKEPFPDPEELSSSIEAGGADPPLPEGQRRLQTGLLNEGKGCWGWCGLTPGDCAYCGTGQCCRDIDFRRQVSGCELAQGAKARCGAYRGSGFPAKMNVGLPCIGECGGQPGDCWFCGTGQCCRACDGIMCVPGCELAQEDNWSGPGSQCGEWKDPSARRDYCPTPGPMEPPIEASPVPSAKPSTSFSPTLPCVDDPIVCLAIDMSGSICNGGVSNLCTNCPSACQMGMVSNPNSCCENFANIQDFSTSIVESLDDEFNGASFSVVQFSDLADTISNFAPKATITPLLGNLDYTGGFTNHGAALQQCQTTFDASDTERSRITLLITDGVPTRPSNGVVGAQFAEDTASTVREAGTFILPVFIAGSDPDAIAYMNGLSSDGALTGGLTFDNLDMIVVDIVEKFRKCNTTQLFD